MAQTTSQTSICNRALQILGYQPISSITDGSRGARAMQRAYQSVLISMLRDNFWNFAIKRASLNASATPPLFGPANSYPLPPDFLDMAPPDQTYGVAFGGYISGPPNVNDYQIEGQSIVSDQVAPINIRYVSSAVTESMFDASFAEAFAALLAVETCSAKNSRKVTLNLAPLVRFTTKPWRWLKKGMLLSAGQSSHQLTLGLVRGFNAKGLITSRRL